MKIKKLYNGFLGYEGDLLNYDTSEIIIVPCPIETSVSYGKGTSKGPKHIIKASWQLEYYDHDLNYEINKKVNFVTLKKQKNLKKTTKRLLKDDKIPIFIGGEHSITIDIINVLSKKYDKLTIIHFDAHSDLRDEYNGNKYSHACSMRRCLENKNVEIISIGIRSSSIEEIEYKNKNVIWLDDLRKLSNLINNKNVYVSFDVDVFDSGLMPATGTPEPGGLNWETIISTFNSISKNSNIIGADIVEFAPIKNLKAYDFTIAKLIYKLIGYTHESRRYRN